MTYDEELRVRIGDCRARDSGTECFKQFPRTLTANGREDLVHVYIQDPSAGTTCIQISREDLILIAILMGGDYDVSFSNSSSEMKF